MLRRSPAATVKIALVLGVVCLGVGLSESKPVKRRAVGFDRASYNSASAHTTARLKYYPPRGWLRHYLGDDRYKIAGNIWTVMTTETDTYYHRPSCPNMRRQSPNNVVGFASPSLAAEAGYVPDPVCQPRASSFVYIGPAGSARGSGGRVTTTIRGAVGKRVILADRVSSVLLPPNWQRIQSGMPGGVQNGVQTVSGQMPLMDAFRPVKGRGALIFMSMPVPPQVNLNTSQWLTARTFKASILSAANSQAMGGRSAADILKDVSVSDSRLGSIPSVTIIPRAGSPAAILGGRIVIAARGNKMYMVMESGKVSGASTIINSFRSR